MPVPVSSRRYYADAYATRFASTVLETPAVDGKPAAVLTESCFYPTSGGQPHDTGRLGDRRVLAVFIREADGSSVHVLDGPLAAGPVEGEVDWDRRFDHMQQHTGQHILSQAFVRVAGANTIGFHLGAEYVSIDLDLADLGEPTRLAAFELANEIVAANVLVRAWFPTEAELATITLRKTPEVDGALRVVRIGEFDVSACGGTHVARTGEIGPIHSLRSERMKRGTRVAFLCGHRARRDHAAKQEIVATLSAALTCGAAELPEAVGRLRADLDAAMRELGRYREQDLDREAEALASGAAPAGGGRAITRSWGSRPVEEIRGLVFRLTARGVIALLGSGGERSQIVVGRPEALALDLKPAFAAALAALGGGRGGGSRVMQGGAGPATAEQVGSALEVGLATLR